MSSTNFLDNQTVIYAGWCNDVNNLVYNLTGSAGTPAANIAGVRTNLGLGTAALQNITSMTVTGGTINGTTIGGTAPSVGTFSALNSTGAISQTTAASFNQIAQNITRSIVGTGVVREISEVNAATTGYVEVGLSFNANITPSTGVWANRDVANNNCWLDKWDASVAKKQVWYSGNTATLNPPTWLLKYELDCINNKLTVNVLSAMTSVAKSLVTVTTNYTVLSTDHTILANATTGALTVTLPSAALNINRIIVVKRLNSVANDVVVASASGAIDNAVSRLLNAQYMVERYQSDGAVWWLV